MKLLQIFRLLMCVIAVSALGFIFPAKAIDLTVNQGHLITLNGKAKTIFIANPDIASYQVPSSKKLFVFGLIPGATTLYALDAKGEVLFTDTIYVKHDVTDFNRQAANMFRQARVLAKSINGQLIIEGQVPSSDIALQVMNLAQSYHQPYISNTRAQDTDGQVVNHLQVLMPNQVNIRVKIAEVSRNASTRLGLRPSAGAIGFENTTWSGNGNGQSTLNLNGLANQLLGVKLQSHSIMLDALASQGAARLLSEPNLTAMSGETASFLAGGEYPVPTSRTADGTVLIQFKEYGVLLNITPTVLNDRRISLKIAPEVSSLDTANTTVVNGLKIPGIKVRRADTTVELASGESFMLGGLLMNDEYNNVSKFPILGDIPILGSLFRSTAFTRNETELVIIAQAYLVEPTPEQHIALPTDNYQPLSDFERLLNIRWQPKAQSQSVPLNSQTPRLLGDNGFEY